MYPFRSTGGSIEIGIHIFSFQPRSLTKLQTPVQVHTQEQQRIPFFFISKSNAGRCKSEGTIRTGWALLLDINFSMNINRHDLVINRRWSLLLAWSPILLLVIARPVAYNAGTDEQTSRVHMV